MRVLTLVLVIVVIGGCATRQPTGASAPIDGPNLRIMTYNVNFGGAGMDLAVAAIAEADADVVCLQETTLAWERALKRALAQTYPHMAFRHSGGAGGQAFLSKYELEEVAYIRETPGWFPGWIVKARTPIGIVQLVNVHLRPPLSERASATPSAYFGTGEIRRDEVRLLSERLEAGTPTLILGDFNESESGKALTWLRERGFANALRQFDSSAHTWEWRTSLITLRGGYDHILFSSDFQCADARVLRRGRSDHFPVVAVMTRDK